MIMSNPFLDNFHPPEVNPEIEALLVDVNACLAEAEMDFALYVQSMRAIRKLMCPHQYLKQSTAGYSLARFHWQPAADVCCVEEEE